MSSPPIQGRLGRIVVASANPDKVAEMRAILSAVLPDTELVGRPTAVPDVDEVEDTLLGNARLKAYALLAATGLPSVADDTGLFVDALDGAPGVRTARYAGEEATAAENRAKLLAELDGAGERTARFRTVVVLALSHTHEIVAEGEVAGHIAESERGTDGFGYDSIFVPLQTPPFERTFAEMSSEEKHALSHRGRALRALAEQLREPT